MTEQLGCDKVPEQLGCDIIAEQRQPGGKGLSNFLQHCYARTYPFILPRLLRSLLEDVYTGQRHGPTFQAATSEPARPSRERIERAGLKPIAA